MKKVKYILVIFIFISLTIFICINHFKNKGKDSFRLDEAGECLNSSEQICLKLNDSEKENKINNTELGNKNEKNVYRVKHLGTSQILSDINYSNDKLTNEIGQSLDSTNIENYDDNENRKNNLDIERTEEINSNRDYDDRPVYIVGAIKNAGIYKIGRKKYLYELVEEAGGLTDEAASEEINLAMELIPLSKYKILSKDEITKERETLYQEGIVISGIDGGGEKDTNNIPMNNGNENRSKMDNKIKIDLNQATLDDLCQIPGIGNKTAQDIIQYRESNGGNISINDLLNIKGIKKKKLDKIKEYLIEK